MTQPEITSQDNANRDASPDEAEAQELGGNVFIAEYSGKISTLVALDAAAAEALGPQGLTNLRLYSLQNHRFLSVLPTENHMDSPFPSALQLGIRPRLDEAGTLALKQEFDSGAIFSADGLIVEVA
jgi:hypothetical protein